MIHYYQADYLFTGRNLPIAGGIVGLNEDGFITEIIDPALSYLDTNRENIIQLKGLLCPGFTNAHCHLELSYLKGKVSAGNGFVSFAKELMAMRGNYMPEERVKAMVAAENEMQQQGIVAVGDISNDNSSFEIKSKQQLFYHTFIELIGFNPARAQQIYDAGRSLQEEYFHNVNDRVSLVPHAPYSVSPALLQLISNCAYKQQGIVSIHNQESRAEDLFFRSKAGDLLDLYAFLNLPLDFFDPTGFSAVASSLVHISACNKVLLVHNTYSQEEDIQWVHQYTGQSYWCFCPNANLYIEKALPAVELFRKQKARIVIGTDSLASNYQLSILEELKVIAKAFPTIPMHELIQWSTWNGAEFLGIGSFAGSLEAGKQPGLVWIEEVDLQGLSLLPGSKVSRIDPQMAITVC
jgi:aminodeoxyfutalosine deaminase